MKRNLSLLAAAAAVWCMVLSCNRPEAARQASSTASSNGGSVKTEKATFAMGCFWGSQGTFNKIPGVVNTTVGYEGGKTPNPTYEEVCTNRTGYAEAVQVEFDPTKVTYEQLLQVFFEKHDPTTVNRQGPDSGTQYRSVMFFHTPEQQKAAQAEKDRRNASGQYVGPIVTQIVPATTFYRAEEYHQQYFEKQGVDYTCHLGNGKKNSNNL